MIKERIRAYFPHHLEAEGQLTTKKSMYVADYTEETRNKEKKEHVKLVDDPSKVTIEGYFTLNNPPVIVITGLPFDQKSFTKYDKNIASQCECVIYPEGNDEESWICFIETKYIKNEKNSKGGEKIRNKKIFEWKKSERLKKALKQLYETQEYYRSKGIFSKKNKCYLFASLPLHKEPFLSPKKNKAGILEDYQNSIEKAICAHKNFSTPAPFLTQTKCENNLIIRFTNSAEVLNHTMLRV